MKKFPEALVSLIFIVTGGLLHLSSLPNGYQNLLNLRWKNITPNLLFAYFPQLDYSSQKYGTNSNQVNEDLKKIDEVVNSIIKKD